MTLSASRRLRNCLRADFIAAAPSAQVGSIGTILPLVDVSGAWEQRGWKPAYITHSGGDLKDATWPPSFTEAHRAHLQEMVDDHFGQFRDHVLRFRSVPSRCHARTDPSGAQGQGCEPRGSHRQLFRYLRPSYCVGLTNGHRHEVPQSRQLENPLRSARSLPQQIAARTSIRSTSLDAVKGDLKAGQTKCSKRQHQEKRSWLRSLSIRRTPSRPPTPQCTKRRPPKLARAASEATDLRTRHLRQLKREAQKCRSQGVAQICASVGVGTR